jgi:hypothetical protein
MLFRHPFRALAGSVNSVAEARGTKPGWRTFLRNHSPDIAGMDLFVVPTIGLRELRGIRSLFVQIKSLFLKKHSLFRIRPISLETPVA